MGKKLTTEEIDKIITNITNVIMSEGEVSGMIGSVSFTDAGGVKTGSGQGPVTQGHVADKDDDKRPKNKGTAATTVAGSTASSASKGGPKLSVKPTSNPLGIYASKKIKENKDSEQPSEPEEVSDIRQKLKDDKEEFPLDLL